MLLGCLVTFQTKLLICGGTEEEGSWMEKRGGAGVERDEVSDCAIPHTLEAQSPLETVLDHGMTLEQ